MTKRRPGRPRKHQAARYPSGQIVHSDYGPTPELLAKRIGLVMRGSHDSEDLARAVTLIKDQRHASLVGILHMRGEISDDAFRVGMRLRHLVRLVDQLLGGPKEPDAVDLDGIGGRGVGEDNERLYRRIMREYAEAKAMLDALDRRGDHRKATLAAVRDYYVPETQPLVLASLAKLAGA